MKCVKTCLLLLTALLLFLSGCEEEPPRESKATLRCISSGATSVMYWGYDTLDDMLYEPGLIITRATITSAERKQFGTFCTFSVIESTDKSLEEFEGSLPNSFTWKPEREVVLAMKYIEEYDLYTILGNTEGVFTQNVNGTLQGHFIEDLIPDRADRDRMTLAKVYDLLRKQVK